ncbi:polymorphic toxin type 25 domain-containing protein [Pectobacterium versatile]|uniref:polymorphic toxin type 25 domain-containing protein n=1 Tax=Pectobacterium versatile TaxID=2488639 RepID=UPI00301801A7
MACSLLLRDTAKQVQDTTTLSRDVEHANNALSPIFNKEKEQKRLKQAQLIGEIGAQVMDIVRTEGELKAQKAAEAKGDATVERPKEGDPAKEWETYKKALTESPTYKAEMQKYGTGSDFQRAAQAATAAIQALAGGDIQKAIASGASPYLAQLVKDVTIPKDESKITASDIAANAMAHAVVGAVVAQLSGQDAAAGAMGASSGELIARAIMADQYPGKTANDLTEEEKQSVSALSTLASGLVSGLAGNSTASAASGAQSGRNAVENNLFGPNGMPKGLQDYGQSVMSWTQYAVDNNLTPEQTQEGLNRIAIGEGPSWGTEYKVKPNGKVEVSGGVGLALKGGAEINNDYFSVSTGYTKEFGVKAGASVGIDFGPYAPGMFGDLNRDYSTSLGFGPGSVGFSAGKDGIGFSFSIGPSIGFTGSSTGSHNEKIDLNGDSTKEIYHHDFK